MEQFWGEQNLKHNIKNICEDKGVVDVCEMIYV